MKRRTIILAALVLPSLLWALEKTTAPQESVNSFPGPDFELRDKDLKPQKSGVVLGPIEDDGKGGAKGSFAIYGGPSLFQVVSLSFSGDGKILAVASTPGRVDLWDVQKRKKLRTLKGGTTVSLSADGSLLAKDGNGIELCDVATGKLKKRIPRAFKESKSGAQNTIQHLGFNPAATLLDVTANGEDDSVYDVSSGQLIATLANTKNAQFSEDGQLLIGGSSKHLIVWNTKDWSKASDLPNGPDYVTRIAAFPKKDLIIIGGPNDARLLRLSSGMEIAKTGTGYTNFAAFNQTGTLIFTYAGSSGFAVWDTSGKQYCSRSNIGNGTVALSPDDRWLAASPEKGGTTVTVWRLQDALRVCGLVEAKDH